MRIAVLGWAGAGKTTVAAALARALAAAHGQVLAVDAARRPRLAQALGLERNPSETPGIGLRGGSGDSGGAGGRYGMRPRERGDWAGAFTPPGVPGLELFVLHAAHAVDTNDAGDATGRAGSAAAAAPCDCTVDLAARWQALATHRREGGPRHQVFDLDAGIAPARHSDDPLAGAADLWIVVLEPYYRALEAAARLHALAVERQQPCQVVANKLRDAGDGEAISAYCARRGLPLLARWPAGDERATAELAAELVATQLFVDPLAATAPAAASPTLRA